MPSNYIDTEQISVHLRSKGIIKDEKKILITKFENTTQAEDFTLPYNCGGFGRVHHFKRNSGGGFPDNPLPIDPALYFLKEDKKEIIQVQVFQNAICSWRCWYCFVDFKLLSGNKKYSEFKTADELLDLYLAESNRPQIIDLSGGQPDLVPEWTLWFAEALEERGLSNNIYLWSDDNLSNDFLWRHLSSSEVKKLASYKNYGRVGCFKGFDEKSFSFNTNAEPSKFNDQFKIMRRIVDSGFDVYGYTTFTSESDNHVYTKVKDFIDKMQNEVHPIFPLRTVPLRILEYSPTTSRMVPEVHDKALKIQEEAISAWSEVLNSRFSREEITKPIYEHKLNNEQ